MDKIGLVRLILTLTELNAVFNVGSTMLRQAKSPFIYSTCVHWPVTVLEPNKGSEDKDRI